MRSVEALRAICTVASAHAKVLRERPHAAPEVGKSHEARILGQHGYRAQHIESLPYSKAAELEAKLGLAWDHLAEDCLPSTRPVPQNV